MKKNLRNLITALCLVSVMLLLIRNQAGLPYALDGEPLATATDANAELASSEAISTEIPLVIATAPDATSTDAVVNEPTIMLLSNEISLNQTAGEYVVNSQTDWDNLFNGVTDSTNWAVSGTETIYLGTVPIVIDVNTDIVSSNKITVPANTQVTINFNNNKWDNSDFNLINGSLTINGVKGNALSVNTTGCSQVIINDSIIDMTNSTNCVANTVSPTEVKFNNCTINQANNYIVSATTGNKIILSECIINNGNSVLMTPFNGELNINNTTIVAKDNTANAIDMNKGTGNTIITDCTITGFNKALYTISNDNVQNPHNISVTNTKFYNNKFGIDFQVGNATSIKISNCDFTLDSIMDGSAAITNKYCFATGNTEDSYTYNNIIIDNYDTGIETSYGSAVIQFDNVDVDNCKKGITGLYNYYFTVNNCDIVGRDYTDKDSYGIQIGGSYSSSGVSNRTLDTYIGSIKSQITNCTIDNVYVGFKPTSTSIYIYKTDITNVNSGVRNYNGGHPFVNECNITAASAVDEDSYGIKAESNGGEILNSTITGFNVGAWNEGGALPTVGCKFINNKIGAHLYCTFIYGSEIIGSEIGYKGHSDSHVISCTIVGNDIGSGVYIDSSAIDLTGIGGSAYAINSQLNNYSAMIDAITLTDVPDKNEICNFEIGIEDVKGYDFDLYDTYIHDCEIGFKTTYCAVYDGNEISDCNIGIEQLSTSGGLYFSNNNRNTDVSKKTNLIHDCEIGMTVSYTGSESTGNYHVEVYDCTTGIIANGFFSYVAKIHDCIDGYVAKSDNQFGTINSYDNENYNLIIENGVYLFPCSVNGNFKTTLNSDVNDSVGNAYIDSQGKFVISYPFVTGNAKYYLTEGSYVYYQIPAFEGVMIFDVPDYSEGRVVAKAIDYGTTRTLINNYKLYAFEEGWVVTYDATDNSAGQKDMWLTAGCEVTYDYETNGGTEMSTLVDLNGNALDPIRPIPYKKGESIDLTPTAIKDGYEFVGWNTNPNATEGLTNLEAGVQNITLYAIYRKAVDITYETYSSDKDFSIQVWFYNNNTTATIELDTYSIETPEEYVFVGYLYSDTDYSEEEELVITLNNTTIYCVYNLTGKLDYLDKDSNLIETVSITNKCISREASSNKFSYTLKEVPSLTGYRIVGWKYGDSLLNASDNITTSKFSSTVQAVYEERKVTSIEVTPETVTMQPGDDTLLIAKVLPEDALNKRVVWYSDNDSIATVDTMGRVYAKADGVVKIWAKTTDGSNLADYSVITVKTPEERTVTVTGTLKYPDGQVVANKTVSLKENLTDTIPYAVVLPKEYTTTTNNAGVYIIDDVPVGEYEFIVSDNSRILASCVVTVAAEDNQKEDAIAVVTTDEDASVDYGISEDTFTINISVTETIPTTETTTPEETPKEPSPVTGDAFNLAFLIVIMLISAGGIILIKHNR